MNKSQLIRLTIKQSYNQKGSRDAIFTGTRNIFIFSKGFNAVATLKVR